MSGIGPLQAVLPGPSGEVVITMTRIESATRGPSSRRVRRVRRLRQATGRRAGSARVSSLMFGALSVLSEGLVLLTLGLVKPWGRRAVAETGRSS